MTNLVIRPPYQPFELPIEAKGRQYIGYFDLSSLQLSPCQQFATFSLIDYENKQLSFNVNHSIWTMIQEQVSVIRFDRNQQLYVWLEIDAYSVVQNVRVFQAPWVMPELIVIYRSCYHFESLYQLISMLQTFQTPALKHFFVDILKDTELLQRWVSLPASKSHHHSYPGGLLAHSLECAYITQENLKVIFDMSQREKEVTLLAALLHDIGKTATLSTQGHTGIGKLLDHELLTLSVLANPLRKLSQCWSVGSEALQYLLTWKSNMKFCKFIGGNVIKLADQISTSSSLNRMAFYGKPSFYVYSQLKTGQSKSYHNRLI